LPFLRFTRDKRGYETTALVHAFRGRHGRTRQKLLYWFRTPPSVKVGRPALDEEAIRFIEEHNPEIDFDWQKILAATPPAAAPAEDVRGRRGVRRGKPERRSQSRQAAAPPRQSSSPPAAIVKDERVASEAGHEQIDAVGESEPSEAAGEPVSDPEAFELEAEPPEAEAGEEEAPEEEAMEQLTHPDAEELPPSASLPIETLVGREQLVRLRARYAELQARINERGGDAPRIEGLRAQSEPLNPDAWVTADEAKKGIEEFEARIRDLRAALGLRRRRRSRRGGRRRQGKRPDQTGQTAPAGSSSNTAGLKPGPTPEELAPGPKSGNSEN